MIAAAATRGDVTLTNVIPAHMDSLIAKMKEMGIKIIESADTIRVVCEERPKAVHIKTLPYPGFPTDMQPQIVVALGLAEGTSIVTESIFENRFRYVDELTRLGANIKVEGNTAVIEGVARYSGANIAAPDLRAGAALVVAGLAAEGFTLIDDIHFVERGYEDFPEKLRSLGAQIEVVSDEKEYQRFKLEVV